jgi:hypothetical protein
MQEYTARRREEIQIPDFAMRFWLLGDDVNWIVEYPECPSS